MLAQFALFGAFPDVPIADIETNLGLRGEVTRRHVRTLEEIGLVQKVISRPTRFVLTDVGRTALGI